MAVTVLKVLASTHFISVILGDIRSFFSPWTCLITFFSNSVLWIEFNMLVDLYKKIMIYYLKTFLTRCLWEMWPSPHCFLMIPLKNSWPPWHSCRLPCFKPLLNIPYMSIEHEERHQFRQTNDSDCLVLCSFLFLLRKCAAESVTCCQNFNQGLIQSFPASVCYACDICGVQCFSTSPPCVQVHSTLDKSINSKFFPISKWIHHIFPLLPCPHIPFDLSTIPSCSQIF